MVFVATACLLFFVQTKYLVWHQYHSQNVEYLWSVRLTRMADLFRDRISLRRARVHIGSDGLWMRARPQTIRTERCGWWQINDWWQMLRWYNEWATKITHQPMIILRVHLADNIVDCQSIRRQNVFSNSVNGHPSEFVFSDFFLFSSNSSLGVVHIKIEDWFNKNP